MAGVVVLLTYDLKTPPGMQDKFKAEMKKLQWKYVIGEKDLPATTCYAVASRIFCKLFPVSIFQEV